MLEARSTPLSRLVPLSSSVWRARRAGQTRKRAIWAASLSVQPVDAVGAATVFNAGFLHKFIHGSGLQDCLEYGNVAAGLSTNPRRGH